MVSSSRMSHRTIWEHTPVFLWLKSIFLRTDIQAISVYCITPAQIFTCVSMESYCLQPESKSEAPLMEVQDWYLCSWLLQYYTTRSWAGKESGGFNSLFLLCFFTAESWPQKESWLWAISTARSGCWPTEQGQGCFVGVLHALGRAHPQRPEGQRGKSSSLPPACVPHR